MTDYPEPFDYVSIRAYERDHPDATAEEIGQAMVKRLRKADLQAFAAAYIAGEVDYSRRAEAREAERGAQRIATLEQRAERETQEQAARVEQFERLLADPTKYVGNGRDRATFRKWAGDRFDDWYERGHAAAEGKGGEREVGLFESDWFPGGPTAYFAMKRQVAIVRLVDEVAEEVRLETTRELLSTVFALGDGQDVTWGEATIEQHQQRVEMLTKNAAGVVETASRHQAAVRMITEAGVTCLADLAPVDAEAGR